MEHHQVAAIRNGIRYRPAVNLFQFGMYATGSRIISSTALKVSVTTVIKLVQAIGQVFR